MKNELQPGISAGSGKPATFSIRLGDAPEYNAAQGGTPATRSGEPLLSEWVKVNTFSVTRAAEDTGDPELAAMELFEDTVPAAANASDTPRTRGVMPAGYTFRVIAFWKNGNQYEYQSVADYTSNGSATPELVRGEMSLSVGQAYRFVAYSFNNSTDMGVPLSEYTWNGTSIAIPDLTNDFMTYDSGDKTISSEAFTLPVSFKHQLCKLTVKISVTGFPGKDTFSNCTGVYVKQGGTFSSWTVGAADLADPTNDSAAFGIPDNGTSAPVTLVPFARARPLTVHFGTLTVGYNRSANNTDITSSQSVKLLPGKSYTMTVRFKSQSIHVPEGDINLGGTNCSAADKNLLARLTWAEGNLRQQNDDGNGPTIMAGPTDYGHYYTWFSKWNGGGTSLNNTDPCTTLDPATYGYRWRTPTNGELESLSRCTDKPSILDEVSGVKGMWFMNSTTGLFLPAAGYRPSGGGSGTTPTAGSISNGYYWSSDAIGSLNGYYLSFYSGLARVFDVKRQNALSVRCVKGQDIHVPEGDINLTANGCTAADKITLSKLTWAEGNLRQQNGDGTGPTIMGGPTEYGHYYTWFSKWSGGGTSLNNTDPCTTLDTKAYGTGWRTPSVGEYQSLARCSEKVFNSGWWFLNPISGLFLPAAGFTGRSGGSSVVGKYHASDYGYYWSSGEYAYAGRCLVFYRNRVSVTEWEYQSGMTVRCVKSN